MSVDKSTVVRIAGLARISVPEEDLDELAAEISNILGWVEQLNEVDTEDVMPMTSVTEGVVLRARDDTGTDGNYREDLLKNAPEEREGFFVVPKVIE